MADKMADRKRYVIHLSGNGNLATVWNKDDALELRKTHRITGSLIGSLPRKPWQNQVMSLPLLLIPEEVTLLVRKGNAILKRESEFPPSPTPESLIEFRKLRETSHYDQIRIFVRDREKKKNALDRRLNTNLSAKKWKGDVSKNEKEDQEVLIEKETLQKKSELESCGIQQSSDDNSMINETLKLSSLTGPSPASNRKKPDSRLPQCQDLEACKPKAKSIGIDETDLKYYSKSTWIHIPTASMECSTPPGEIPDTSVDWKFPVTEKEKLSYAVFSDLWEKGYFITTGEKFGCDFLVYPGEPSRYHSHFIVMVLSASQQLSTMELLAYGRLGTGVKKTVVFAIVDETKSYSVHYQSLAWAGIDGLH